MGVPAGGVHMRDRAKTVPTLRASGGASTDNGSDSITVTVSTAAQVGDFLIVAVSSKSQAAPTVTPSGMTLEHSTQMGDSASQPFIHIFSRRIVAGDVSTDLGVSFTFAFAAGSTDGICGSYQVWANTNGFSVRPTSTFLSQTDTVNSHSPAPCSITGMGPYDVYGGVAAVMAYVSAGTANATLTTPPSGTAISSGTSVTALRAGGTGGTCRGQAMWHGTTRAAQVESLTYPAQEWTTSCVFALAPIPQRFTATQMGPPSLAGLEVFNYSNSSGACVVYSQSDVTRGCNTYRPWPERVAQAFGPVNAHLADGTPKSNNMAMGGARAPDICTAMYGTFSYTSVRAGANNTAGQTNQYNPQVLTKTALPGSGAGLFTTDLVGNDFLKLGTDDVTMRGTWNAVDAILRLLRAGSAKTVTDASHTYSGTWTDVSDTGLMGGASKKTTVAGSKVTIALTNVDTIDLVLVGYDDTALGVIGSAFTVKVDGVVRPTAQTITLNTAASLGGGTRSFTVKDTTSNQHQNSGAYKNYKYCQVAIEISGIGAGSHTVEIAPTIAGGSQFEYNGYLIPATTPPWITTNAIWRLPNATYTASPYSFASAQIGRDTADWFNQIVAQAAAQFTDGKVIYFDPSAQGTWDSTATTGDGAAPTGFNGWDAGVHVSTGDGLHQSDLGHGFYAWRLIRLLNERIASPYTPHGNPSSLMPQTLPSTTFTLVGTRRLTVASTFTGTAEAEGGGGAGGGGGVGLQGRGGGGGAYAKKNTFTLTAGAVIEITVGRGGAAAAGAAGGNGTVSKVVYISGPDFAANTVLVSADFGVGGAASTGSVGTGGLSTNCVGDTKTSGSNGTTTTGGAGASPLGGTGGAVGGNAGSNYGGAGGGANAGTANAGGPGAQGVVKFT